MCTWTERVVAKKAAMRDWSEGILILCPAVVSHQGGISTKRQDAGLRGDIYKMMEFATYHIGEQVGYINISRVEYMTLGIIMAQSKSLVHPPTWHLLVPWLTVCGGNYCDVWGVVAWYVV